MAQDNEALLKAWWCAVCVLQGSSDVFVPAGPIGRSQCELGWMKINRSGAGHMVEI